MSAVYKKELRASLSGMTGAIFIAYVLVFLGIYCSMYTFFNPTPHLEYAIIDVAFLSLLAVPVLTMRSFSEERHTKTDQLLYSLPISTGDVVLGKYFAMTTVFAIPSAVLAIFPLITASFCTSGSINFATIYGTIICYYLLGCAIIAICMFLSTLTESQVIAAIFSIGTILLLFFMSSFSKMVPSSEGFSLVVVIALCLLVSYIVWLSVKNYAVSVSAAVVLIAAAVITYIFKSDLFSGLTSKILSGVSLFNAIENFRYGVFDITAFLYYISVCCLFIFFTAQSVEKRRWS